MCYLAAEGRRHQRRELAELLWPQSDEHHARTDLRSALAKLRKTLGEDSPHDGEVARFLIIDGDLLGIEPRGIELDLERLDAAVSLARTETSPGGGGGAAPGRRDLIGRLRGDLELYRGEFMESFSLEDAPEFELWLEGERARWRRVFGELCERLSRLQGEMGQSEEAIETARLWARYAPLEEAAHRRLVELLSAAGDSEGALLAYEDFRDALSRELESEPSPQMQELAGRLEEEVEARSSLSASLLRSEAATQLSVLEVPLAGRHEEFGALVSEYHAVRMGQTRVAVVLGEAGIGKTRLVSEFLHWARAREADVLEGGAAEGGGLPYGPLVEAIRPRIERERAPDDLLEDVWLSELSRLLPELKERYPDLPPSPSGDREMAKGALFEAVARLVGTLASGAPVVLFLDDLEWADAATLEVLDYASKRWAEQGAPVLLLIAARPGEPEVSSTFERWLSALGRRLPVRSLTLGPLGNEDVKGLLGRLGRTDSKPAASNGAEPGLESFGEWLAAETAGQPFYLVETIKALLEEGALVVRNRADGEPAVEVGPTLRTGSDLSGLLPANVRQVIRARLSHLSPAASELLRAGAVLERGFDFESLVGMAGLGEEDGLMGLDELIERHLLREETGGGTETPLLDPSPTYSFSHEKIRQVVYTESGHARRRVLHHRAFEVLEESSAPPAELARHALAGGLAEPAFGYSVAAGDQAMEVFAVKDAIEHYERARSLLAEVRPGGRQPTGQPVPDLEHLYIQLGRAYEMVDEWRGSRAAYEALLALGRELGEARLEVVALNHLAVLDYHQGEVRSVRTLLDEARRVAEEAGLVEALAETECNLADVMTFWVGESEHSRPLAEKALASARALERPDLVARALVALARVEVFRGRLEEAAAYAEEGAALSRQLAERPPSQTMLPTATSALTGLAASWRAGHKAIEIQCLTYLAYARNFQGRLQEGLAIAREAHAISRELPERTEAMSSWALSLGLAETGEYEEALVLARRGVELARKAQDRYLLAVNLDRLGRAHEALLNLEEARAAYAEPLGQQYEPWSSARLCAVATLSEDWEEACAHAKRASEAGVFANIQPLSIYLQYEVEALLRGGEERLAREEVRRFDERARTNVRDRVSYLRSLAVLSDFEGDSERATVHLRQAEELAERLGLPGELWRIQTALGEHHERRGEDGQARAAFSRATQTLRSLAQKIDDKELREGYLSASQARRVLERS